MARKIVFTIQALENRKAVLEYWNKRNGSNTYSRKLNRLFFEALQLLKRYPYTGRNTVIENVYVKVVRDYLIFYEIKGTEIVIYAIWDSRRNPDDLKIPSSI